MRPKASYFSGVAIPGVPNLSRMCSSGLAGAGSIALAAAQDSRPAPDVPFRWPADADDLEAIAAQLYVKLKSGYAAVASSIRTTGKTAARSTTGRDEPAGSRRRRPREFCATCCGAFSAGSVNSCRATVSVVLSTATRFRNTRYGEGDGIRPTGIPVSRRTVKGADEESSHRGLRSMVRNPFHRGRKKVAIYRILAGGGEYLLDKLDVDGRWCLVPRRI